MLKVWLPLDGDLRNLGASNVEVINNGATVNDNGKIGKCYYFNNSVYLKESNYDWSNFNTSQFSLCCWYKEPSPVASGNSQIICIGTSSGWNNIRIGLLRRTSNGCPMFSVSDGSSYVGYNFTASNFTFDTWNHIAVTYNNGELKMYLNGSLDKTGTTTIIPTLNNSQHLGIGSASNGAEKLTGYLNDIRIYDHCLSAAEVHEIAMGLVLHYKLNQNFGLTDIIQNQDTYAVYNNYSGSGTTGTLTNLNETYQGHVVRRETMTPNDTSVANFKNSLSSHGVCGHRQTFLANTKYVFWIYFRPISHMDMRVGGTASNISGWTEIPPKEIGNGWYRVGQYRNGTVTSDKTDSIFTSFRTPTAESGVPITIDWAAPHLLAGTTEIPSYDFFIENEVIDSSGYGHNGTITGNITTSFSTPRYNASTKFPDSACAIAIGNLAAMIPEGIFTFNIWFKKVTDEWSSKNYETILGGPSGFELEGKNGSTNSPVIRAYSWGGSTFSYTLDEWHMLTMIRTTTDTKFYLDGKLKLVGSAGSIPSGDYFIGAWKTATQQNYRGYLSDARIYCTPLLDTDIKLLYNMGMRVDNLGGVHTFEFDENQPNLMWRPENARAAGLGMNYNEGLGSYTQSNCQVTCDLNGYRIYRPPNLTVANNGNTMWGGLRVVNSTNGNTHIYNGTTDNIFGLTKGHTYIIILTVKGKSGKTASSFGWTNQMGWGGGGLSPNPSNVIYKNIGNNFNGETECYYKFTISDDIVKTCTTTYSGFTSGNQYLSYRDFMFGFVYESTESLGTDLYISNIRLFDLTNKTSKNIQKSGIIEFTQFIEKEENITKIRNDEELYATEFIEI